VRARAAQITFVLLAALAAYGIFYEHLFQQPLWDHQGWKRLLIFATIYWPIALIFPWRSFQLTAVAVAVAYSIWLVGLIAPLATLFLFASAYCLGKLIWKNLDIPGATAAGIAIYICLFWFLLHLPVNHWWLYAIVLSTPLILTLFGKPNLWHRLQRTGRGGVQTSTRNLAAASVVRWVTGEPVIQTPQAKLPQALLFFTLLILLAAALKPEVSSDALSMHLALPMKVAELSHWPFDFQNETWSLMPSGGDGLYTASYLLGGEAAARLTNFGLLALISALIIRASKRYATQANTYVIAALFASTPLALLVTGSLFVENIWTALILAAFLELTEEEPSLPRAALFMGAALEVKLIAAVFLIPATALALRRPRKLFPAIAILVAAGAPVYLYAWTRSGNPIFPFANTTFKSPYFQTKTPFADTRFSEPLTIKAPYDLTFHSTRYFEGAPGSSGLQYLVLLLPALLLLRRKSPWQFAAVGAVVMLILLAALPNLRYLYPAMALLSVGMGTLLAEWPIVAPIVFGAITLLNIALYPTASPQHTGFMLLTHAEAQTYIEQNAPIRLVLNELNRISPDHPVVIFGSDATAGLKMQAYTNTWHSDRFTRELERRTEPAEVADLLRGLGANSIAAPENLRSEFSPAREFMREYLGPTGFRRGGLAIFHLRDHPLKLEETAPLGPGIWDDLADSIVYSGRWYHDWQFPQTFEHSVTYSSDPDVSFAVRFKGSAITYIYTKAANRGRALIKIDGKVAGEVDLYSAETLWQSRTEFGGLIPGEHTFQLRVAPDKSPKSTGTAVDIDALEVRQ
jgi:hypothetical protein